MSVTEVFVKGLQEATGKDPFPEKFWGDYPEKSTHTFQDALDKYAKYYHTLNPEQQKQMSALFWNQIKEIGTPIIEDFSDEEVKVHFLFPRDNYDHETKKLYISGDFHGFTSTDNKRQEMHHKLNTDIMHRGDVMPRDSVVTYTFLAVPEEYQNKSRQELIGEVLPKSFYALEDIPKLDRDPLTGYDLVLMSSLPENDKNKAEKGKIYLSVDGEYVVRDPKGQIREGNFDKKLIKNGDLAAKLKDEQFVKHILEITSKAGYTPLTDKKSDEYAKHTDVIGSIFRANVDNKLSDIKLFKDADWKKLLTEEYPGYLKNLTHKGTYLCDKDNHLREDKNAADMGKIWNNKEDTRSVSVFQSGNKKIKNLIIIHDGVGYMGTGTIEGIDALIGEGKIPKDTAIICISPLPGLIEKYKKESPKEFAEATDPRPIEYASRIDDYITFIDQALSQLDYDNVPAENRTLIGASMSGTASVYMTLKHKDKFGHAIAQAPTEGTRIILLPLMQERIKAKELDKEVEDLSGGIHLSCGKFETLEYAQNIRLAHTEELAEILGSHNQALPIDKTGNYGHLPHCWSVELTNTLPNLYPQLKLKNPSMLNREKLKETIKIKIPGTSIAIMKGESNAPELYQAGVIDVTNPQPVTKETVFEAASLSKPVFAYIVLKQIEKGLLSRPRESPESGLDRPLHEICDFGPPRMRTDPNYKLLTARMLLSHQAGLPNKFGSADNEKYVSKAGTQFDYSGEAYRFLNDVIEHVTGKKLHELSQEIFNSNELGMKNSSFIPHPEGSQQRTLRAMGHDSNNNKDEKEHFPRQFPPHPAASLMTTAEDYSKFMHACLKDPFIRKHLFEEQINLTENDKKAIAADVPTPALNCLAWRMGIGLQKTDKGTIAFHWGDNNTFRSFFAIHLDKNNIVQNDRAVVCLTNSANGPSIFKQVAEPVVGDLSPALTWLKLREKLPIELKESKKSIEQPSVTSKSIFPPSQKQEPPTTSTKNEEALVLRKKGG